MSEQDKIFQDVAYLISIAFAKTKSYVEIFRGVDDDHQIQMNQALFSKVIPMVHASYPNALHYFYEYEDENAKNSINQEKRNRKIICSFTFMHTDSNISLWEKLRFGLLWMPFEIGMKSFLRMLQADSFYTEKLKSHLNGRKAIEVDRMVVHPSYQGKGIGFRYLNQALIEEADKPGLPVILGTQDERNVRFYSKL
jgi:hypothetical protein